MFLKRVIWSAILTIAAVVVTLVNTGFTVFNNSVYSLSDLPQGERDRTMELGKPYVVTIYTVDVGGRLGRAVRAEAKELETGKSYTVYWETGTDAALVSWVEDSDVQFVINDHMIELTPDGVHYDSRTANLNPSIVNKGAMEPYQ